VRVRLPNVQDLYRGFVSSLVSGQHPQYGIPAANYLMPIVFLQNGQILIPQTDYDWGKKNVDYWITHKTDTRPTR
jgi:hypothetical protein